MRSKIAAGVFAGLGIGYFVGVMHQSIYMRKKLKNMSPVITSSLVNVMQKFQEDEMTYDEIREYAANELNFLKIILGGKNDPTS